MWAQYLSLSWGLACIRVFFFSFFTRVPLLSPFFLAFLPGTVKGDVEAAASAFGAILRIRFDARRGSFALYVHGSNCHLRPSRLHDTSAPLRVCT